MEGFISSVDRFQLLRMLSFTPRAEFLREGYVHMALFFSALALCFWGFVVSWWRKYAQSVFVLSLSPFLSFRFNATRHQIQITRVPAMMFALDRVSHVNNPTIVPAEENKNERASRGKIHMRFECSLPNPEELPADDFSQNREGSVSDCKNSVASFCSSGDKQILGFGNIRNYEEECLETPKRDLLELLLLPEEIVKSFDVSESREVLAASTVNSINTVRVWDIPASKCVNNMNFDDGSVVAGFRFSKSPHFHMLSGIAIAEGKSSLYVWDTRNYPKPLSFSLGKNSRFDIVEFNDKKVCVCDDLSKRVFDLRMPGAPVLEDYPRAHGRDGLRA